MQINLTTPHPSPNLFCFWAGGVCDFFQCAWLFAVALCLFHIGDFQCEAKMSFPTNKNDFVSKCQEMKDIAKRNPCNILVMKGLWEGFVVVEETNPKHI